MTTQIPNTFVVKYRENVRSALQQKTPKLAPLAMEQMGSGEMYKLEDITGADKMVERTERNADTRYGETSHDRVWVPKPNPGEYARLVDSQDKLQSGIELTGQYVVGARDAHVRYWDDKFIQGFYGDMLMGKTGGTVVPFAAANIVPVSEGAASPTGMNVDKIKAARQVLAQNFVDMDQPWYMAVTAAQVTDLFGQVEVTSADFQSMKGRLSDDGKKLVGMLGFEFVEVQLGNPLFDYAGKTVDGAGYRLNPFWSKDGMCMVPWEREFTDVTMLPTKSYSTQVFHRTVVTATRTDNGRCGYIRCAE